VAAVILVAGEALFDLVMHDTGDELHGHPGGAAFNAARTIGRLEQPVAYLGRLSIDRFGRRLDAMLEGDGVARGSVVETNDPTTLAIAEVDREGVARYRFYERGTSASGLTPEAALKVLPAVVEMLHVGTLGLTLEPVATATEAVVERLAPGGALVAVDPNIRPWVIADEDAYRARLDRGWRAATWSRSPRRTSRGCGRASRWSTPSAACSTAARRSGCSRGGRAGRWW
jgi:fructokinase